MKPRKLFLFCGLLLLLGACGKKGPVRPLSDQRPGPVSGVELRQQGPNLLLSWQLPDKNLDNSPLTKPPQVDIYRMRFAPANDCPECIDHASLLFSIDPDLPTPAIRVADRYLLVDHQVIIGQGYRYKLVPRSSDGKNGRAVSLQLVVQPTVAAPVQLEATSRDHYVLLSWAPLKPVDGETLVGYQVYRQQAGAKPSLVPLNSAPVTEARFEDFTPENGIAYIYRVRALIKRGEQTLEGLASSEVVATPNAGR